jgi:hypothetical protein
MADSREEVIQKVSEETGLEPVIVQELQDYLLQLRDFMKDLEEELEDREIYLSEELQERFDVLAEPLEEVP